MNDREDCPFCEIIAGRAPATIVREWHDAIALVPLDPVTPDHTLVIPRIHVQDATTCLDTTATVMRLAAELAGEWNSANILTAIGKEATQSVFHLHVHVIPRVAGDQLMLPWGTTGDPHAPHWCKIAQHLKDQLSAMRGTAC